MHNQENEVSQPGLRPLSTLLGGSPSVLGYRCTRHKAAVDCRGKVISSRLWT